ncbi:RluA family pseudouridine synthase [Clostridium tetani]|nr:RluA family pseudouridine synthase [Clostridium tetani]AVP55038.1 RluA family pseudouridine synthase [Clostridium tetani]KGI39037.1 pseudouridylate synthase [Clostridium tetani]KGI39397.1 pseudouridylate synthase [Clostridium tetani ATCC 9441]KGI43606.1 pseudouridylate synthase [Clostridium tetani]KGI44726.1 pseudouridylate synthase [Clostridium tetani]
MSKLEYNYEKEEECNIKEYLKYQLKISGRFIRKSARNGRIKVNGNRVNLRYILNKGDHIEIDLDKNESQNVEPEKMELDIVYEDEDILVINKNPGIVVHPTKSHPRGTLSNGILYYFEDKGENCIVRLVSRLDRDTSGLIIIAKNQFAHMALARDMNKDTFKKFYLAIIHGKLTKKEGTIDLPIYRPEDSSLKRVVDQKGQRSITHYKVVEEFKDASLVEFLLETGRTHQIRVHVEHLGHPIIGDSLYGNEDDTMYINRQALHAYKLVFPHPRTGEILELSCDIPSDIKDSMEIFKKRENN